MPNIYAAPTAKFDADLGARVPKPISVLLLQALATVIFMLLGVIVAVQMHVSTSAEFPADVRMGAGALAMMGGCSLFSFALAIGLERRSKVACFTGVISCMALPMWLVLADWVDASPSMETAEMIGRAVSSSLIMLPFVFWAYLLGFTHKTRAYFGVVAID